MLAQPLHNEFRIKPVRVVVMAALAGAYPLAGHAAGAARIDFATADVKAVAPDGRSRPLAKGAEVASGETVDTGNGRAQLRFSDGAQMALAPQTQFRIDEYRFNGKADGSERGFFSLVKGAMRTITGLVGRSNHDHYKVTTSVATIGIRGTEYSVAYQGESIGTTTGEGSTLVCNAAGCLILDSGETAFVTDPNTKPALTGERTEIPPPPAQENQLPGFVAGDDTQSNGMPAGLAAPGLLSGPGYAMAYAGNWFDGAEGLSRMKYFPGHPGTSANFDAAGTLIQFVSADGGEGTYTMTAGTAAGALSDGIIGWGRWISASEDYYGSPYQLQNTHYVVGMPTPDADMAALYSAGATANYTLSGYTYPTAYNSSTNTTTFGTQPISGSLTADFGAQIVSGSLSVPMGGNTYSTNWSGSISGSLIGGYGPASGSDCTGCGCNASVQGFFAGPNAARAGLVYQIDGSATYGTINGAAVFTKGGSAGPSQGGGGFVN